MSFFLIFFLPPPLTCVIGAMTHVWKCVCVMCAEQWFKDWRIVPITPNSFGQLVQFGTAGAVQYVVYPTLHCSVEGDDIQIYPAQ